MPTYSLTELAKLADVTPRTIRFYISQGLLPSPEQQGPATRYSDEHLAKLLAIKKLQNRHLPLAEIRRELGGLSVEDVTQVAESTEPEPSDAIDYIREILEPARVLESPTYASMPMPSMALPVQARMSMPTPPPPAPAPAPATAAPSTEPPQTRSQWERVSLDPDVELHIRQPLTRQNKKRVERLIAIARELFKEED